MVIKVHEQLESDIMFPSLSSLSCQIMLLDEATSALDASAEREVQTALDRIMVSWIVWTMDDGVGDNWPVVMMMPPSVYYL